MMFILDKMTYIYIIIICVLGFFTELIYMYIQKEKQKNNMFEQSGKSLSKFSQIKKRLKNSKIVTMYESHLKQQIDLTFSDDIASVILQRQQTLLLLGIGIFIGSLAIFPRMMSLLILIGFTLTILYPNMKYSHLLNQKKRDFDRVLPVFIGKVLLTLNVGMNIENSMAFGVKSIDEPIIKKEFEKLMVEMRLHPDDITLAFMNLRKRIPGSQECEKFSNIVVSGIKNGHQMSQILRQENQRISDNQIKAIRENHEKKSNISTAITILCIFLPALLLFLVPLMTTGGID